MSLQSRTLYLASIASEVQGKLDKIQAAHSQIQQIKSDYEAQVNQTTQKYDSLIAKAESKGRPELSKSLEKDKQDNLMYMTDTLNKNLSSMLTSVETTANGIIEDTDGISGTVTVDVNSISFTVDPELFNRNTDFVKNSLVSPETQVLVSTTVTGTAGGYPIVGGVGAQVAGITTT